MVEHLNGLGNGMLVGEVSEWRMHTGALVLLDPIESRDLDIAPGIRAVLNAPEAIPNALAVLRKGVTS